MGKLIKRGLKLTLIFGVLALLGFYPKVNYQLSTEQFNNYFLKKEGNWIFFKNGFRKPLLEFFEENKLELNLTKDFGIHIVKADTDKLGMVHYLCNLTYKNVIIDNAWYTAHYSKDGDLLEFVGSFSNIILPSNDVRISQSDAITLSINAYLDANIFSDKLSVKNDLETANQSNGRLSVNLVYYRLGREEYVLAYKVILATLSEQGTRTIIVDAKKGNILKNDRLMFFSENTVNTLYNGTKSFQTKWSGSYYYLLDESKSSSVETRNSAIQANTYPTCIPYNFASLSTVSNGSSTTWSSGDYYNAASAHWAVQEAYNVFKDHFGRTYGTFDDAPHSIRVENHYYKNESPDYINKSTFYEPNGSSGDYIHAGFLFGSSQGYDVGLDVLSHEFTHGCIYRSRSVGGTYSGCENGALLEGLCDIFGEVIEYYVLGSTDYEFGTNCTSRHNRDFINPLNDSIFGVTLTQNCSPSIASENFITRAPAIRKGTNWYSDSTSSTYNYVNCFVLDHWFYLLAHGGTENGITVSGIGIPDAAEIVYEAMMNYFTSSTTFYDLRTATILRSNANFGNCSNHSIQTTNAWAAVGLGSAVSPCIYAAIDGPSSLYSDQEGQWDVEASGGTGNYTYAWYVDDNLESTSSTLNDSFDDESFTYHDIEVYVSDGTLNTSDNTSIGVNPIHYLTASIDGTDQLESGEEGIWYAYATGGEGERYYFWTIDGNYVSDAYYLIHTFYDQEETYHMIRLTVTSGSQNAYADPINLRVYTNRKKMSQGNNQIKLNIYPNPTAYSTEIEIIDDPISGEINALYEISIYDYYGKLLLNKKISEKRFTIDTSSYPDGIYTITVTGHGKKGSAKFIIKK